MMSSSSATPAPLLRRDEAHRDQVAFAQRLLQRRVQFAGVDVAVVQVAVDEVGVDLDHLLHQRAVRGVDRAEVAEWPSRLKKQSTTFVPPASGRFSGRHSLPKVAWICASSRRQVHARARRCG
jgi:hypothetical protein